MAISHSEINGKIISAGLGIAHFARKHPTYSEADLREALIVELTLSKVKLKKQVQVSRLYRDRSIGTDVIDLVVENVIAVQVIKAPAVPPDCVEHVQSYLRDSGLEVGFILNFGAPLFESKQIVEPAKPTPSKSKA